MKVAYVRGGTTMANAIFQIGPYELKNELGRGKTGIVYEAIKPSDKQAFAVKILHPNLTLEEQVPSYLDKKLEQISRLNHPNIVQILDYGQAEGRYYIVLPRMPYGSLMDQIAQYGALNQLQAKAILENVLYGLQYLHQLGLSHGNLHPGNILIDSQGVARISDFGVSELMSEAQDLQSQSGGNKPERLGKPGYVAPELWRGDHPDPQSDIFSLGCIAHEMLTGKRPFEAERPDQFQEQGLQPKLALSDELSQEWRAFIEKCLAVDPLERYRSAGAAFEDLRWGLFAGANRLGKETDVLKIDYEDGSEPDSETDLLHNRIEWIAAQEDQPYVEQWYGLDPYAPTPGQALEMQSMQKQRSSKTLTILLSVVVLLAVIVGVLLLRTRKQRVDLKDPNIRIVLNDLVKADIHEIQLSPDGKTIAIASSNGIYFYNSKTLEEENAIANELDINSIAWSPNGKFVVSGGKDNTVRLWNTKDGDEIYQMLGHQKPINRVVFSGDGLKIASGSQDRTIRLWDTGTGEELNSLSGHSGPVNALAFSPDDETLASGSDDGTVRVWNVETGEQITEFDTGAEAVVMVEYTGDGQQIYTGYADEDTEIWDLDTGERVQTQEDDDPDILDGLADEEPLEPDVEVEQEAVIEYGYAEFSSFFLASEGFYLTYDKTLWSLEKDTDGNVLSLKKEPNCKIFGFKVIGAAGPEASSRYELKEFNGDTFEQYVFSYKGNDEIERVTITEGPRKTSETNFGTTLFLGEDLESCREQYWDVVELSQKNMFTMDEEKKGIGMFDYPIVYLKDYNIWVYYPYDGRKVQITFDGGDFYSEKTLYSYLFVSPSGEFIAYMIDGIKYGITNLQTMETFYISKSLGDRGKSESLVGWDKNDYIYYETVDEGCDPNYTPKGQKLWRVHAPSQGSAELVYEIPKPDIWPNEIERTIYITGKLYDSGQYLELIPAACATGGFTREHILDIESGEIIKPLNASLNDYSVSNDERNIAILTIPDQDGTSTSYEKMIEIVDSNTKQIKRTISTEGYPIIFKGWSFDDKYLAYSETVEPYTYYYDSDQVYRTQLLEIDNVDSSYKLDSDFKNFSRWSPYDHSYIATIHPDPQNYYLVEIWLYYLDGSEPILVDQSTGRFELDW